MSKEQKSFFFCTACGTESLKWQGRCGACGEWNALRESPQPQPLAKADHSHAPSIALTQVRKSEFPRIFTGLAECDRVLGGGCVPGSLILLSGDPGVGKSTLILQALKGLAYQGHRSLYVSGEESPHQIFMRADRLAAVHERIEVSQLTELGAIFELCNSMRPKFLVIDSIQTISAAEFPSSPGSILQVRECAARLMNFCKERMITCFVVGQVTKEGHVAGPKLLEHLVDTVLYLEGDSSMGFRLLRAIKNRFGSTGEMGVFLMTEKGLEDVTNPSALFLSSYGDTPVAGSAVSVAMEGSRSFLLELQILVGSATYSNPRRIVSGMDSNRLSILVAVLEKRAGLHFAQNDVYASVAGGLRVSESAHDLAIVAALVSGHRNKVWPTDSCFFGEVSLSGAVRPVSHAILRIKEALKLGFKNIVLPASSLENEKTVVHDLLQSAAQCNGDKIAAKETPRVTPVKHIADLFEAIG